MRIQSVNNNYQNRNKQSFKGEYDYFIRNDVPQLPQFIYNYFKKGGEADDFVKKLSSDVKVTGWTCADKKTIGFNIKLDPEVYSYLHLKIDEVSKMAEKFKLVLKTADELIQEAKPQLKKGEDWDIGDIVKPQLRELNKGNEDSFVIH